MNEYSNREIKAAPERLVVDGEYVLGCFNTPVERANLLDVNSPCLCHPAIKWIQLREWQAFQILNEDYFVMIAIYNAKKIALVQFILYNKKIDHKIKYEKKVNPWELTVPDSLHNGSVASYKSSDFSMEIRHDLASHKLEIDVDIDGLLSQGYAHLPAIRARFRGHHDTRRYMPMVVCNPFSSAAAMYSHKCLMPMEGTLQVGGEQAPVLRFDRSSSQLIIDDHKGYYPYVTRYDWVTALGRTGADGESAPEGRLVGFNLTNNQVTQQEQFNENCLWLDGILHPLPPVTFDRQPGPKSAPERGIWRIRDKYGLVFVDFWPSVQSSLYLNYGIVESRYEGPYGTYHGYIIQTVGAGRGEKVSVEGLFGMGEDFYLRV